jgi:hypothetical protein
MQTFVVVRLGIGGQIKSAPHNMRSAIFSGKIKPSQISR